MKTNTLRAERDKAELVKLIGMPERDLPTGRRQVLRDYLMSEIRFSGQVRRREKQAGVLSPAHAVPAHRLIPGRDWKRVIALVSVAGVVAASAAAAGVVLLDRGGLPPATPGAVKLLTKIAYAASRQPVPHVRDGQYTYIETESAGNSWAKNGGPPIPARSFPPPPGTHLLKPVKSQTWLPVADLCRPGLIRMNGQNEGLDGAGGGPCPDRGGLNDPTYRLLQSLPTNPRTLLAMIYKAERGHGNGPAPQAFTTIGDLLQGSIAPPRVSAALFRAAALIPGVTVVPDAVDAIGRHGVAVAQAYQGIESEWIFDRASLQLIGERTIATADGVPTSATAIVARGFADKLGQVPQQGG